MLITVELFQKLSEFTGGLVRAGTLDDLADKMELFIESMTDVEYSAIYLYDFDEDRLRLVKARGFSDDEMAEAERTAMERHPGLVFRKGEMLNIPDTDADPKRLTISSKRKFEVRSRLYVPIMNNEQVVGVFGLVSSRSHRFGELEVSLMRFVANTTGAFYGDLVNRKRLQRINEEVAFLSTFPTQNPFPTLRILNSGQLTYANRASLELTGFLECSQGEPVAGVLETGLREALRSQEIVTIETAIPGKIFSLAFVPVLEFGYVNVYGNDITKRKAVEEELLKMSRIAQETYSSVVITNEDGKVDWVNRGFESLTGYKLDEIRGKVPGEFLQGPGTDLVTVRELAEAINNQQPIERDILNYSKSGTPYWVKLQIQPIYGVNGQLANFISIQQDITDLKRFSEEKERVSTRLSTLIKNLHEGILLEDESRKIVLVNRRFCEMFGLDLEPEQLVGIGCQEAAEGAASLFSHPDTFLGRIAGIIQDGVPVIGEEIELQDGRVFERDFIPIYIDGNFFGVLWKYNDVSIRIANERELKLAKETADEANQAKSRFLTRMSHEIRTPMNAIHGLSQILAQSLPDAQSRKMAGTLHDSSRHLLGVVNEILDFSKIESGWLVLEKVPLSIRQVYGQLKALFAQQAAVKHIDLAILVEEGISDWVLGDPLRFAQIINNLVGNAIKFTPSGGKVSLEAKLVARDSNVQRIRFSVEDTGIGISEKSLELIFREFRQEDEQTSRQYGGTGLGLPISKRLVELMGGHLEVVSCKGEGSRFWFEIDLEETSGGEILREPQMQSTDPQVLSGLRVLVVEDNQFNLFYLELLLKQWGLLFEMAGDGQEAIDLLRLNRYDLILMDLEMPRLDGYEAASIIRNQLGLKLPMIALTADILEEHLQDALDVGFNDYLVKPFEPGHLFDKMERQLRPVPRRPPEEPPVARPLEFETALSDIGRLRRMLDQDETQVARMVQSFLTITPAYYEELLRAYESGDYPGLEAAAHRIKSSLGLVANARVTDLIKKIEAYSSDPSLRPQLPPLVDAFRFAYPELCRQLQEPLA